MLATIVKFCRQRPLFPSRERGSLKSYFDLLDHLFSVDWELSLSFRLNGLLYVVWTVHSVSLLKVLDENEKVTEPETDISSGISDNTPPGFPVESKNLCVEPERKTHPTISGFDARTDYLPKCLETCGNEESTVEGEENKFKRIINGITPDVNDWPFLVHLFFYNTPNIHASGPITIQGHLCGGTGRVYSTTVLREVGQHNTNAKHTLEKFSIIDGL